MLELDQIADELVNGYYCVSSDSNNGWEQTKGKQPISENVVYDISRIARNRVSIMTQSKEFQNLMKEQKQLHHSNNNNNNHNNNNNASTLSSSTTTIASTTNNNNNNTNTNHHIDLLTHSQIVLGDYLGGGGFSSIYAVHNTLQLSPVSTTSSTKPTTTATATTTTNTNERSSSKRNNNTQKKVSNSNSNNNRRRRWKKHFIHPHSSSLKRLRQEETTKKDDAEEEEKFVVKVLKNDIAEGDDQINFARCVADIIKEGILMASFDHPNILKSRALASNGISSYEVTKRPDAFFVVMGQLSTTLNDKIYKEWKKEYFHLKYSSYFNFLNNNFQQQQQQLKHYKKQLFFINRLNVALQLANALSYLHKHNMLHRDIKPCNIGFDTNGILKLFDFDMARFLPLSEGQQQESSDDNNNNNNNNNNDIGNNKLFHLTHCAGSFQYMSPECAKGEPYNLKSDVYSFALIVHEILSLQEPYGMMSSKKQLKLVFQQGTIRPKIKTSWPKNIQNLLIQSWSQNISNRPTMNEVYITLDKILKQLQLQVNRETSYTTKTTITTCTL